MKKPKISVIMPVYNAQRFLKESLDSVLNQTFRNFELIVINDCSTDNSLKILKEYKEKDNRIKIIENKENIGPAGSRNRGLKKSKGKYIAIFDSDDVCMEKRFEIQYNYLENNSEIYLIGSSAIFIDESGKTIATYRKFNNSNIIRWRLPKSCGLVHSSVMFRNTKEANYNIKSKYAHDYNLYLDLLSKGKKITNLSKFLVKYRISPNSISVSKNKEQEEFRDKIIKRYSYLNEKISIIRKIYYSSWLLLFYIRTFLEKRGLLEWKE